MDNGVAAVRNLLKIMFNYRVVPWSQHSDSGCVRNQAREYRTARVFIGEGRAVLSPSPPRISLVYVQLFQCATKQRATPILECRLSTVVNLVQLGLKDYRVFRAPVMREKVWAPPGTNSRLWTVVLLLDKP